MPCVSPTEPMDQDGVPLWRLVGSATSGRLRLVGRNPSRVTARSTHHIHALVQSHPHSGATYRLVSQLNNSFGVEVTIPGMSPTMVTGFAS